MSTTKIPSPVLLVFILLNFVMIGATLTFSPWDGQPYRAAATWSTPNPAAQQPLIADQPRDTLLAPLLQHASAIAYGHVLHHLVTWNDAHTQIETHFTVAVVHPLVGQLPEQVTVVVPGGYLPAAAIGMWSSHRAVLADGEAVLLFLKTTAQGYEVVRGEKGKFTVEETTVTNAALGLTLAPTALEAALVQHAAALGRTVYRSTPAQLHRFAHASGTQSRQSDDALAQLLADPKWADPTIRIKINVNSDQAGAQANAFREAILRALRTWSVVADADFTLLDEGTTTATSTGYNGLNEILFTHKGENSQLGQAQIWFTQSGVILEADIWLNDDYTFSTADLPAVGETDLESVVLHELGHWAPLDHTADPNAVMYAVLNQSTKRVLQEDDLNRLIALYPCGAPPCINEVYLNPTPTATPTLIPTAVATPTLVPTVATPTAVKSKSYLPLVTR